MQELLSSKNMRSLKVLIARENKIKQIEGPYGDLEDASEKQLRKGVMKLQVLDVRSNLLTKLIQDQAVNFLKDTVVLMWDNPLDSLFVKEEILEPRYLFNS